MRQHCLQCWQVLFRRLFLIDIVCRHHLRDLMLYTWCMVISFLALWSIYLNSSLVHCRNIPEYLTRRTAQVFIPLISFMQYRFVASSFLVLLRYSFLIFSLISTCLMVLASKIPKIIIIVVIIIVVVVVVVSCIFIFKSAFWWLNSHITSTLQIFNSSRFQYFRHSSKCIKYYSHNVICLYLQFPSFSWYLLKVLLSLKTLWSIVTTMSTITQVFFYLFTIRSDFFLWMGWLRSKNPRNLIF